MSRAAGVLATKIKVILVPQKIAELSLPLK